MSKQVSKEVQDWIDQKIIELHNAEGEHVEIIAGKADDEQSYLGVPKMVIMPGSIYFSLKDLLDQIMHDPEDLTDKNDLCKIVWRSLEFDRFDE